MRVQPGASPGGKEKVNHHFHREPCAGSREGSGEASAAACAEGSRELICGVMVMPRDDPIQSRWPGY